MAERRACGTCRYFQAGDKPEDVIIPRTVVLSAQTLQSITDAYSSLSEADRNTLAGKILKTEIENKGVTQIPGHVSGSCMFGNEDDWAVYAVRHDQSCIHNPNQHTPR